MPSSIVVAHYNYISFEPFIAERSAAASNLETLQAISLSLIKPSTNTKSLNGPNTKIRNDDLLLYFMHQVPTIGISLNLPFEEYYCQLLQLHTHCGSKVFIPY